MRTEHMAAFMTWLGGLPVPVHDSDAPLNPDGSIVRASYVVAWDMGPDVLDDDRVAAPQAYESEGEYRFVTKSVGTDPAAARAVRDAVAGRLTGHRLTIAGRNCDPIRLDPVPNPMQPDTTVSPPLWYIEDDWIVGSRRT